MIKLEILRNTIDEPTCVVDPAVISEDGKSDSANARITGSYPPEPNEYSINRVSDMEIVLLSGAGKVIINSRDRRIIRHLNAPGSSETVRAGEAYFYSAEPGESMEVSLRSKPQWSVEQYEIVIRED